VGVPLHHLTDSKAKRLVSRLSAAHTHAFSFKCAAFFPLKPISEALPIDKTVSVRTVYLYANPVSVFSLFMYVVCLAYRTTPVTYLSTL